MQLITPHVLARGLTAMVRALDTSLATGSIQNARAALAENQHTRQLEDEFAPAFDEVQVEVMLPG